MATTPELRERAVFDYHGRELARRSEQLDSMKIEMEKRARDLVQHVARFTDDEIPFGEALVEMTGNFDVVMTYEGVRFMLTPDCHDIALRSFLCDRCNRYVEAHRILQAVSDIGAEIELHNKLAHGGHVFLVGSETA